MTTEQFKDYKKVLDSVHQILSMFEKRTMGVVLDDAQTSALLYLLDDLLDDVHQLTSVIVRRNEINFK